MLSGLVKTATPWVALTHMVLEPDRFGCVVLEISDYAAWLIEHTINVWPAHDLREYYDMRSWLREHAHIFDA